MPADPDPADTTDRRGRPVVLSVGRSATHAPDHRWRRTVGSVGLAVAALLVAAGSLAAVGTWVLTGGSTSGRDSTPIWEAPRIVDLAATVDGAPAVAPSPVVEAPQHPAPATTPSTALSAPVTDATAGSHTTPTTAGSAGTTGTAESADPIRTPRSGPTGTDADRPDDSDSVDRSEDADRSDADRPDDADRSDDADSDRSGDSSSSGSGRSGSGGPDDSGTRSGRHGSDPGDGSDDQGDSGDDPDD